MKTIQMGACAPSAIFDVPNEDSKIDRRFKPFRQVQVLGELKVPAGYSHRDALCRFAGDYRHEFAHFCETINSRNFASPSKPVYGGERFRVSIHEQQLGVSLTDLSTRLSYVETLEDSWLLGPHGIVLLYTQMKDVLPKGTLTSLDQQDALSSNLFGRSGVIPTCHGIPAICVRENTFETCLVSLEGLKRQHLIVVFQRL